MAFECGRNVPIGDDGRGGFGDNPTVPGVVEHGGGDEGDEAAKPGAMTAYKAGECLH